MTLDTLFSSERNRHKSRHSQPQTLLSIPTQACANLPSAANSIFFFFQLCSKVSRPLTRCPCDLCTLSTGKKKPWRINLLSQGEKNHHVGPHTENVLRSRAGSERRSHGPSTWWVGLARQRFPCGFFCAHPLGFQTGRYKTVVAGTGLGRCQTVELRSLTDAFEGV